MSASDVPIAAIPELIRDACLALGWSQRELSRRSGVPQTSISRFLKGRLDAVDLSQLSDIATATGARLRLLVDAPFLADRARQRDAVHARCIGFAARRLRAAGWQVATEVEIRASRGPGWIDALAFHPGSRRLLVMEIKTEIDDLGRIQRTLGWYQHEAWTAAARLGWRPRAATAVLLLLATRANDQRLRANAAIVREAFPTEAAGLRQVLTGSDASTGRWGIAMIDPCSRASIWLRPTTLDRRHAQSPYENYAEVARRLSASADCARKRGESHRLNLAS